MIIDQPNFELQFIGIIKRKKIDISEFFAQVRTTEKVFEQSKGFTCKVYTYTSCNKLPNLLSHRAKTEENVSCFLYLSIYSLKNTLLVWKWNMKLEFSY